MADELRNTTSDVNEGDMDPRDFAPVMEEASPDDIRAYFRKQLPWQRADRRRTARDRDE